MLVVVLMYFGYKYYQNEKEREYVLKHANYIPHRVANIEVRDRSISSIVRDMHHRHFAN